MKEEYQQASTQVLNVLDERGPPAASGELNLENLRLLDAEVQTSKKEIKKGEEFKKKNEKPLWAMTKEAVEDTEDKEVEDLLDFFEQNQVASFSQDEEIKVLLSSLKGKIEKMKEEDNWKEKEGDRMRQDRQARADDHDEDKYSQFSAGNSEGRSVAS